VYDNVGAPNGTVVYYNVVTSVSGGAPGGVVPFNTIYPLYAGGALPLTGIGQGVPIPPGVYLARLSVPAVGESPSGFTKGCFVFTWDGTQLTAGAISDPSSDFTQPSCYIGTFTNGTTGVANILVWGWRGLTAVATAQIEVVLLQQLPYILPLI